VPTFLKTTLAPAGVASSLLGEARELPPDDLVAGLRPDVDEGLIGAACAR
jgi:hypothetical protein